MSQPIRRIAIEAADVHVFSDPATASEDAVGRIAATISRGAEMRGKAVLGLATGATPLPIYAGLVREHRSGRLSFARVSTYNLDEYHPMGPLDPNSYRSYMHRHLFGHVDLAADRAHVLDGTVPEAFAAEHAADFDRWIKAEGGLDLQLLGLGRNGHIGFNEPTDLDVSRALDLPTRLVELHPTTIADAARDFGAADRVPRRALTMGIAPILSARTILVVAFGPHKAEAVAQSLRGPITARVPGSLLRHASGKVTWLVDEASASGIL